MEKEIKIQVPEGYEIDKEKSTFEKIVFKKKEKKVNSREDLENIRGVYINYNSSIQECEVSSDDTNKNVFLNEKYAKSALALAQISQLLPYYDSNVDWYKVTDKYCIVVISNKICIETWESSYHFLAFNSIEEAKRFLKHNEQLVKDYYML